MIEDDEDWGGEGEVDDEKWILLTFPSQQEMDAFLELHQKIKDSLPLLYELMKKYDVIA